MAAAVGALSLLGLFAGEPTPWSPWPTHSVVIVLLLANRDVPLSLTLFCVVALQVGAFFLWQAKLVPRPSHGTGILTVLLLLSLGAANAWWLQQPHWFAPDGRYIFLSVVPPMVLAVVALVDRRRWSATHALVWHGLIFSWIGYGAFPYLGELP